jgi:formylmethanofuran dehydrogenase subunit C
VAGDGEAASGFECSEGNAIITGDIDELEGAVVVDDGP